jgi:hypothetical protein
MSAQALVRLGSPIDLYYQDSDNARKQIIPTVVDTRYIQEFSSKNSGNSVFTIPPNQGISQVVVVLGYGVAQVNGQTGNYALARGWAYEAIEQISFRVGGSSQYFLTGSQLLARNLRLARTQSQRDAILQLGGSECKSATDFDDDVMAYVPLSIWAATGEDELNLPLPSDLLSQQIQITVQLRPPSAFWKLASGGVPSAIPSGFDMAYFQVQQVQMKDRGMALANRVNMDTEMYSMALPTFDQFEAVFQLAANSNTSGGLPIIPLNRSQPVVLTGFRAGEVKKIQIYLTKNSDTANPNRLYPPKSVQMLYAGQVYANFQNGSTSIWNLINGTSPAAVNQSALSSAAGVWTSTPVLSQWSELPMSQYTGSDFDSDILTHGMEITNGIINLNIVPPVSSDPEGQVNTWTLHCIYVYNCTLGFSKGTADLIF